MTYERDAIQDEVYKGYRIQVVYDQDASSPRDDDGNATMITWDRDYNSPDSNDAGWGRHDDAGAYDFLAFLKERKQERHSADPGVLYQWLDRNGYDGSLDIEDIDEDNPRSMHRADGVIYVEYETIREWRGTKRLTAKIKEETIAGLCGEVEVYNLWATGQAFGYVVSDDADDHIDSCWGFIGGAGPTMPDGDDYAMQQGKEAVDSLIAHGRMPAPSDEDCEDDAEEEIAEYVAHFPNAAD